MNKDFWRDKRVAIAGGASFIASHTIEQLLDAGARVKIIDDLSSGSLENVPAGAAINIGDLRYYKTAYDFFKGADVALDFSSVHGGRGFVGTNHEVAISDNFAINTNVVRAAVENKVERIFFASSGCIYDTSKQMDETQDVRIPESWEDHTTIMHPDGMYGLTKLAHEKTLKAYHNDGLIKVAICRFFTVFGRRMKENHFILATIAKSFAKTDPFYIWGNGDEVRNFTPVQNTVQGLILATEQANGEIYNIGLEQRITIKDAVMSIWDMMGWTPKEVIFQPDKPVGIRNRVSDCTKARTELGWNPIVSFEEGLRDTIDWYVSTHDEKEVRETLERKLTER